MRLAKKSWFLIALLIFGAFIVYSVIVNYHLGFFNWIEPETYLRFYLSEGSVIDKVFNYIRNDIQQIYRARELSNLLNYVDAELLVLFARIGFTNLLSPIHYLIVFCITGIHLWYYAKTKNKFVILSVFLLSCIYLTSPSVFLPLEYFRTAKIAVSAGIVFFLLLLISIAEKNPKEKTHLIWVSFMCSFVTVCIGLLDEFGMLFSLLFLVFFVLLWFGKKQKSSLSIVMGTAIGLVLLWIYRNFIGPAFAENVTNIYPKLWDVQSELVNQQATWTESFKQFFTYCKYFFGNIPLYFSWLPIGFIGFFVFHIRNKSFKAPNAIMQSVVLVIGFCMVGVIVVHLMSLKVVTITSIDSALVYYPLPWHTFWYGILCLILSKMEKKYQKMILGLLFVWLLANGVAIPGHIHSLVTGSNKEYFGVAHSIVQGINAPNVRPYGKYGDETTLIFHKRLYNKQWQY